MAKKRKIGPTGKFPEGKLNEDDQGELAFHIGHHKQKNIVFIDFNHPVHWFAMSPTTAMQLAKHLIDHANRCNNA